MQDSFYAIDHRAIDITDMQTNRTLSSQFRQWIDDGEWKMRSESMPDIWRENELYYEGYQVPIAMQSNDEFFSRIAGSPLSEWVANNFDTGYLDTSQFRVKKNKKNQIYFVDNKMAPIIDRMAGDLTAAELLMSVESDDDPSNNNIEKMVKAYLTYYSKRKNLWEQVVRPSIQDMLVLGLTWVRMEYDRFVNLPLGDISFRTFHPVDVIVDPLSVQPFFLDARFIIPKIRMELNEAREWLKQYGVKPESVSPDSQDNNITARQREDGSENLFVTIHLPEYKMQYMQNYPVNQIEPFQDLQGATGELRRKEMMFFSAIYTESLGVVHHEVNQYTDNTQLDQYQFNIIPFYDQRNRARLYPKATIEKVKNLQDIVNITKSLMLNNARDRNTLRVLVSSKLVAKNPKLWDNFVRYGGQYPVDLTAIGGADDIRKHYQQLEIPALDPTIYQFLQIAEQSIKDLTVQHEALEGNYPKDKLSGVAIQKLQERNQAAQLNKPQNIEWAMTTMATGIYNVIAREFTSEHWAAIDGYKYKVPINKVMTMVEFEQYIAANNPNKDFDQAMEEFTDVNIVDTVYAGFPPEAQTDAQAVAEQLSAVFINFLKAPASPDIYHLGIRVNLNTQSEQQKLEEKIIASELLSAGKFPLAMFLEMQGGFFEAQKDRILQLLEEENQVTQVAAMIAERGEEFVNAVMQMAAQWDAAQKAQKAQQNLQQRQPAQPEGQPV